MFPSENSSPLVEFLKNTQEQPKYDYINQSKYMDELLVGGFGWKGVPPQVLGIPIQRYLRWIFTTTPIDRQCLARHRLENYLTQGLSLVLSLFLQLLTNLCFSLCIHVEATF